MSHPHLSPHPKMSRQAYQEHEDFILEQHVKLDALFMAREEAREPWVKEVYSQRIHDLSQVQNRMRTVLEVLRLCGAVEEPCA
mgnify:CR=1 FL=1